MIGDTQLARQLWAIGDDTRIRLLRLLPVSEDCDHGNNVSRLAEVLGLAQPSVSHHLRILRQAGLIRSRKMCRDVYYWRDPAAAAVVLERLETVLLQEAGPEASRPARKGRQSRAAAQGTGAG